MRSSSGLFSESIEKINLFTPLLFFALMIWEYSTAKVFSANERTIALYITKVVFLNHLHVYFTFAMMLFLPEVRDWIKTVDSKGSVSVWTRVLIAYCIFLSLNILIIKRLNPNIYIFATLSLVFTLYAVHHGLLQFYGISRMYKNSRSVELYEKPAIYFIFFIVAIQMGLRVFLPKTFDQFATPLTALSLLVFVGLFCTILKQHKLIKTNKVYYISRYLFIIFIPTFFTASIALACLHGIEYLFVFLTASKNSTISLSKNKVFWGSLITCCILGILGSAFRRDSAIGASLFYANDQAVSWIWIALANLTGALSLVHFYMDGKLFSFKNNSNQEYILPLLQKAESANSHPTLETTLTTRRTHSIERHPPL